MMFLRTSPESKNTIEFPWGLTVSSHTLTVLHLSLCSPCNIPMIFLRWLVAYFQVYLSTYCMLSLLFSYNILQLSVVLNAVFIVNFCYLLVFGLQYSYYSFINSEFIVTCFTEFLFILFIMFYFIFCYCYPLFHHHNIPIGRDSFAVMLQHCY